MQKIGYNLLLKLNNNLINFNHRIKESNRIVSRTREPGSTLLLFLLGTVIIIIEYVCE